MYGIQGSERFSEWDTWTHTGSDGTSDDRFSENNGPWHANSGGGTRTFTFEGSAPNPEAVRLDPTVPFSGAFTLSLNCEESQDSCSKEVRIDLLYGQNSIGGVRLLGPVEEGSDHFEFNISHEMTLIEENVSLGLRIEFTKPHDLSGGYSLYLENEFYLDVPALPPEEFVIEVKEGDVYQSPFEVADNGYDGVVVKDFSTFIAIFWGVAILICGIPLVAFTPSLGMKIPAAIIAMLGLIFSMTVMPFIVMMTPYDEAKMGKEIITVDDIVSLGGSDDQFLSGLPEGEEFQLWIPLDSVYENSVDILGADGIENMYVYGLGFDAYQDIFSDSVATTKHGLSQVQGFFSLLEVDPSGGHGILIDVRLVKRCSTCNDVVPEWGTTMPGDQGAPANETRWTELKEGGSTLHVVPKSAITVTNQDPTWMNVPMNVGIGGGVLLLGIGGLMQYRTSKTYDTWMSTEDAEEGEFEEQEV